MEYSGFVIDSSHRENPSNAILARQFTSWGDFHDGCSVLILCLHTLLMKRKSPNNVS